MQNNILLQILCTNFIQLLGNIGLKSLSFIFVLGRIVNKMIYLKKKAFVFIYNLIDLNSSMILISK